MRAPRVAWPRPMVGILSAALGAALVSAGCAVPAGPPSSPPPARPIVTIVDADAYGAIVYDEAGQGYRGIRRDGTTAWRHPDDDSSPIPFGCAARCPDAVLSGSIQSLTEPGTPDPAPQLIRGGQPIPMGRFTGPHRRLLTAAGPTDFVAATGDDSGRWQVSVYRPRQTRIKVASDAGPPVWQQSPDGRVGLLLGGTGDPAGDVRAQWFIHRSTGWYPDGPATSTKAAVGACVSNDGRAVLVGQGPILLGKDGGVASVTDLVQVSACALSASGGILAELGQHRNGPLARIRAVDPDGTVVWRGDVSGEVTVTADPTGSRVAWLSADTLHEIDLRTGKELRVLTQVLAARYDGAGGLVTIAPDRTVSWRSATG